MVWNYGIYSELWSFLLPGAGEWLRSESSHTSGKEDNIFKYLRWIKVEVKLN